MVKKVGERLQFEQLLSGRRCFHHFVFQHPGEVMWDEDGVQTCSQRWVDVGAGAVADHPRAGGLAAMVGREREVGIVMFFRQNLNCGEVGRKAGAFELSGLFGRVALCYQNESVAGGEILESFSDAGKKFYLVLCNAICKAEDAPMLFVGGAAA